jgi:hypothetical protein
MRPRVESGVLGAGKKGRAASRTPTRTLPILPALASLLRLGAAFEMAETDSQSRGAPKAPWICPPWRLPQSRRTPRLEDWIPDNQRR